MISQSKLIDVLYICFQGPVICLQMYFIRCWLRKFDVIDVVSKLLPPANEVWGKVKFSVDCVKNFVHSGGGGLPQCMLGYHDHPPRDQPPPRADTPRDQDPPPPTGEDILGDTVTRGRYASYWNAILFIVNIKFLIHMPNEETFSIQDTREII